MGPGPANLLGYGEDTGVVVVDVERAGELTGVDRLFSLECDLRGVLLRRVADVAVDAVLRVMLLLRALDFVGGSGLDSGRLSDFWRRRRSVDEGRFSVASSCCDRLRLDFRLEDLSGSIDLLLGLLPLLVLFTGLSRLISFGNDPASVAPAAPGPPLMPDFIVDVRILGEPIDLGDSRLLKLPIELSTGHCFRGDPLLLVLALDAAVEGICPETIFSLVG